MPFASSPQSRFQSPPHTFMSQTGPNTRWRFRHHQIIPVWVDFSFPVVVVVGAGASPPVLTIGGFEIGGFPSTALAEYVEGSGTSRLQFEYTVSSDVTFKLNTLGKEKRKFSEIVVQGSR